MKRASALIAALLVAGGVAAIGLRENRTKAEAPEAARSSAELATSTGTVGSGDDELRRLRAEVQSKDRIIRALMAGGAAKDATNAPLAAATTQPNERAAAASHARQVLDERLAATSASPFAAELEGALTAAMSTTALGTARIAERRCGGALCRVTVAADSPLALNTSIEALIDHLPKVMGASAIYEAEDGSRDVYLARTSDALALEASPPAAAPKTP
jgi:hypothetical protein